MKSNTIKLIAISAIQLCASTAFSHENHGWVGSHWHASDVAGLAALGVLIAVAVWLSRK
jgi:hypothetical protein